MSALCHKRSVKPSELCRANAISLAPLQLHEEQHWKFGALLTVRVLAPTAIIGATTSLPLNDL
jgi:hypothetical protein